MDLARVIVADNGSGTIKAGFGGNTLPEVLVDNVVGRPKYDEVMASCDLRGEMITGNPCIQHRGVLRLSYPMERGEVFDWNEMEAVWSQMFASLAVPSSEHPLMLTTAPFTSHKFKEKAAEIMFEQHKVPSLFFAMQGVLSLYGEGKKTGIVLDVGETKSHAVPIYEGRILSHAVLRSDVAGRDVTRCLQQELRLAGHNLSTSAEFELVRQIKEQVCSVSMMREREEKQRQQLNYEHALPDGQKVVVGSEAFRAPEVLFDPSRIGMEDLGVADLLADSLKKCDIEVRAALYPAMYLSGGSTLFKSFSDRVFAHLRKTLPRQVKCRLHATPERKYTTWIGGALLSTMQAFRSMMVTQEKYKDEGAACLFRNAFA